MTPTTLYDIILEIEKERISKKMLDQWITLEEILERTEKYKFKQTENERFVGLIKNGLLEERDGMYRVKRIRAPKIIDGKWVNK